MYTGGRQKVINYYSDKSNHVFACFVDLTKAFDRVNYYKLFNQLISDGVDGLWVCQPTGFSPLA